MIEELTTVFTLEPGDVLATGTPAGVGGARKPHVYLKIGDVVKVEIEGIGHIQDMIQKYEAGMSVEEIVKRPKLPQGKMPWDMHRP